MIQTDYAIKRDRIAAALRGIMVLPKGRSIRRFMHGRFPKNGKMRWCVGYTWCRTYANSMTGMVYDVWLGEGDTFEAALQNAVERETRKRVKQGIKDTAEAIVRGYSR